jgi:hypothetical protein
VITVVLFGEDDGLKIGGQLRSALSKNGGVVHIYDGGLFSHGCDRFLLYETVVPPVLETENGVIIFKNRLPDCSDFSIPTSFTAVVGSENSAALRLLKNSGINTISCGMSACDTLSLSSIDEHSGAVSLQRTVKTVAGQELLPREIPVRLVEPLDEYAILAACAVVLLYSEETDLIQF